MGSRPLGALRARPAGVDGLDNSVALAWGKHLFPFRTEKLSPTAPMVLVPYGAGRVGRRRFFITSEPPPGRLECFKRCQTLARCTRSCWTTGCGSSDGTSPYH